MKSDAAPIGYTSDGLEFSDGTELKADVIVFTTGFVGNMRHVVADVVGQDIADRLEDFWGVDAEGEILGAFKYSGREYCFFSDTMVHAEFPWQIRDCGIWAARLDMRGTIRGLWRCRSRLICLELLSRLMR